jgi:multiple sugar transport system substrate-binding protein
VLSDPELSSRIAQTYYYFAPGKTLGTSTSNQIMVMFYNKAIFDKAGLSHPPAFAGNAWNWDEFVATAKRATTDVNGRHPDDPEFDPERIDVYGVSIDTSWWGNYYPFIYSNGGEIVNDAGTRLLVDSPEAIEAIQRVADLMWEHHVAPTPAQAKRLPSADVLMQTGKLAMVVNGQWKLLDYSSMQGLRLGIAVLPKMKQAYTLILGSPTVIFAGTKHLDAAVKLYKFHNDPNSVDLFARGLWMPLQQAYYTEPDKIASWLDNPAHPAESMDALVNYTVCCAVRTPHFYVKNFGLIGDTAIQPAVDRVFRNEATAAEAMRQAVRDAAPLMAGRWDR